MMSKTTREILLLALITIILTLLIWLPHYLALPNFYGLDFRSGFATIYRNYDGLEYIVIAKSFYNPSIIGNIPNSLPANYYASHFPGFALAMIPLAIIFGFLKSMLFTSVLFTIFSVWVFYLLIKDFKLTSNPFFLAIIFLLIPARWLIVHSVGSSEPMFIFLCLSSIYFFLKFEERSLSKYLWFAGLLGAAAQFTRPPGILLFIAFSLYISWKLFLKERFKNLANNLINSLKYYPLLFIPLILFAVFYWFSQNYNDFWAYFKSGDNIHLTFPPFLVFNKSQYWVGEIWLEDIIWIFIFGLLGGLTLLKQKLFPLAFFVLTYLGASMLVAHRDISRYTLPIFPFVLIAFEKILVSREFKIVLIVLSLAIYLYAQNFLIHNTAPVANLSAYN